GQRSDWGEGLAVVGVDDEACHLVGVVRNNMLVKECGEGQIGESILGSDLFLACLSRNAGQLVATARRRGLGEECPEVADHITATSDRCVVHRGPVGWMRRIPARDRSGMRLLGASFLRYTTIFRNAGRIYGLLSASFVLLALLSESTMMYARLALSVMAQRREREGRLMTMDMVAASIAHEINQRWERS